MNKGNSVKLQEEKKKSKQVGNGESNIDRVDQKHSVVREVDGYTFVDSTRLQISLNKGEDLEGAA
ncbi:hypothetical protein Scep_013767 [Stephania cephalantha]|uniref:Uncharacterized protein n=1 Tax=Stephania cephalantha TaxID=152367 RepID=A0AAP0J2I7_9MAGN